MRRRDFIKVICVSAAAWPLTARAQQGDRIRRVGVLSGGANDPEIIARIAAFRQAMQEHGWREGALASYGPDLRDLSARSASYVDRILKGEKPADLPVQEPLKYDLVINLKTAKSIGLTVPLTLLATADEVIE
jgi:putative ABC transport system substrate-binding protein